MNEKPNVRLIGMFVLTAAFVLIGTFLLINRDNLSSNSVKYVLYFDGSVKGLSVGSAVVFNGVPVGRVENIALLTDMKDLSFKIPVTIEISTKNFHGTERRHPESLWSIERYMRHSQMELFHELIAKGLRARLITQSILTGQMMIELSFFPDSKAVFRGTDPATEIPTVPSSMAEFSKTFQNLPIHQTVVNLNDALQSLNTLLKTVNANAPELLAEIENVSQNVNLLLAPNSQTVTDLNRFLREASMTAQSLRSWADYLERHPEALLKGKGGR